MKRFPLFPILVFVLVIFISTLTKVEAKPTVNLIYKFTGFGLGRDAKILTTELRGLGYSVRSFRVNAAKSVREADINIFLEEVNEDFFPSAKKNYLIPNPEWFLEEVSVIPKFDMILCKTREAERIFKEYHPNTVFMGFTSIDRYDPKVQKNFRQFLHMSGKSQQKGTDNVAKAWELNSSLPGLTIYRHQGRTDYTPLYNMRIMRCFLPDDKLIKIQNSYGIHLCPSETEGFGQYLMEAMSCGIIPITTDAPPMNEFVIDERCLAAYTHTKEQHLAINYYVDPVHLGQVAANLMLLSDEELAEIGKKNREFYLESKRQFQKMVREIFAPQNEDISQLNTGATL